ncbi:MAG TPA: BBE domain-containing protein [Solirubrobacter sp.]|nr:BBE domain-containing protein [Solirubrobacter sp.]
MNTLLDGGFPGGSLNYWRSSFTRGLPDALIDTAVGQFAAAPSPTASILFEHFHGAVTRVPAAASPVPHREPGWNLLIPTVWTDPGASEANIAWTRGAHAAPRRGPLAELPRRRRGRRRGPRRVRAELRTPPAVKRRYDPDNVFHLNQNITG